MKYPHRLQRLQSPFLSLYISLSFSLPPLPPSPSFILPQPTMQTASEDEKALAKTRFLSAAKKGEDSLIEEYLADGGAVDVMDSLGETALHWAARAGSILIEKEKRGGS